MELAGSISPHLRPAFVMEDTLEDGSLNLHMWHLLPNPRLAQTVHSEVQLL